MNILDVHIDASCLSFDLVDGRSGSGLGVRWTKIDENLEEGSPAPHPFAPAE